MKFPTTPPAQLKHRTGNNHNTIGHSVLLPDSYPLTKSKSHESQLGKNENGDATLTTSSDNKNHTRATNHRNVGRARLPTEPGPEGLLSYNTNLLITSPIKSPPLNNGACTDSDDNSSSRSSIGHKGPRTPTVLRSMGHQIAHRFQKSLKIMPSCDVCQKPVFFGYGLKCKECKYRCHRECLDKVTPSCGLPKELLEVFKKECSEGKSIIFSSQIF